MRYAKARQKKESNTFPGHRSHTTYIYTIIKDKRKRMIIRTLITIVCFQE